MPPSPLLQKWQRNKLFEAIRTGELDPREFELENSAEARVKHKWSRSFFMIRRDASLYYAGRYVVGDGLDSPYDPSSWQHLMTRFSRWISEVKDDLDTPDLWAELQREADLLRGASTEARDNAPFTQQEQEEIERRLRELESQVAQTCTLPERDVENLHAKIDYLVEAAGRVGRIDWRNLFIGGIASYLITGIPPEPARYIFHALVKCLQVIGHLFGQGFPELPIGGL
jgi:hypothetical protein